MQGRGGWILLVIGGGIFLGAFFLTNWLLDYQSSEQKPIATQTKSAPKASTGRTIFTLVLTSTGNNWSTGESKTTREITPAGISLIIPPGNGDYGFRTDRISSVSGKSHSVRYDISVTKGSLNIGILDAAKSKLVQKQAVSARTGVLNFSAPSDSFIVGLFNDTNSPASAVVSNMTVQSE